MYAIAAPRKPRTVVPVQHQHQPVLSAVQLYRETDTDRHGPLKAKTGQEHF